MRSSSSGSGSADDAFGDGYVHSGGSVTQTTSSK